MTNAIMTNLIQCFQSLFNAMPLSLLEGWGRFGYAVGLILMVAAFSGICIKPGERWRLGRERQHWDTKALLAIALTFMLVIGSGYLGSFIVLVPGAQTFESLKDLSVFLCVVLFGRPALIAIPFAYGIADLAEGVPPAFLWDWLPGYFINPACFWVALQLIGKNPDFRLHSTWGGYALFVLIFMSIEPLLWGYICADKFTAEISYRHITPALFFTTLVTWVMAPLAMLVALPLAKRCGFFWAEIPGYVKQRRWGDKEWRWQSGKGPAGDADAPLTQAATGIGHPGFPIRMFLAVPLLAVVLTLVILVAFLTLRSGENGANALAERLHQEIALNIDLQIDNYLEKNPDVEDAVLAEFLDYLLKGSSVASRGRALLIDQTGRVVASSASYSADPGAQARRDPVVEQAIQQLTATLGLNQLQRATAFRFTVVTAKPLARETWLAQAAPYQDRRGRIHWIEVIAMPESAYLAEVRAGNSQSAIVLAIALMLALLMALLLASLVAAPLRRVAQSARQLAEGDLAQRVAGSKLEEVNLLAGYFNDMASCLQASMANLEAEVVEQKRMKEAVSQLSERLQLATHAANIGIWEWNIITNELIWDEAMYRLYGIKPEDFSGAYDAWTSSLHPADQAHAAEEVKSVLAGVREYKHEFTVIWPSDGSSHVIRAEGQTLRDAAGTPVRMIGMNIDITQSRRAEEELRKHRDHLEELVAERTAELTIARDQADTANRSKSLFLSNMSHEIRTPLNAITGMTYLALTAEPDARQQAYLTKIDTAAQSLLGIINDILDFSKIEAGKLDFESAPFLLDGVVSRLQDLMAVTAEDKGLQLHFAIAPEVPNRLQGDELRLGQVLLNLVNNAVKFTEQGRIDINITCLEQGAQEAVLQFEVRDTGIGMTPEQCERLFIPFEQAEASTTRQFGGTGLGLSICKKLVEMMGGGIAVASQIGRGSCFSFTARFAQQLGHPALPRRYERDDSKHDHQGRAAAALITGSHVLLVEDNDINQELAVSLLQGVGVSVDIASNGQEAVAMVGKKAYDAVLMDCQMPVMDGYAATRAIREDGRFADLPILAMSANVMVGDKEKCLAAGMNDHIGKPINVAQLFQVMAHWIAL